MSEKKGEDSREYDNSQEDESSEESQGQTRSKTKEETKPASQNTPNQSTSQKDENFKEPKNPAKRKVQASKSKTKCDDTEQPEKPPSRRNSMQKIDSDISMGLSGPDTDALFSAAGINKAEQNDIVNMVGAMLTVLRGDFAKEETMEKQMEDIPNLSQQVVSLSKKIDDSMSQLHEENRSFKAETRREIGDINMKLEQLSSIPGEKKIKLDEQKKLIENAVTSAQTTAKKVKEISDDGEYSI